MPKFNDFDLDIQTSELSTDLIKMPFDPTGMSICTPCNQTDNCGSRENKCTFLQL